MVWKQSAWGAGQAAQSPRRSSLSAPAIDHGAGKDTRFRPTWPIARVVAQNLTQQHGPNMSWWRVMDQSPRRGRVYRAQSSQGASGTNRHNRCLPRSSVRIRGWDNSGRAAASPLPCRSASKVQMGGAGPGFPWIGVTTWHGPGDGLTAVPGSQPTYWSGSRRSRGPRKASSIISILKRLTVGKWPAGRPRAHSMRDGGQLQKEDGHSLSALGGRVR